MPRYQSKPKLITAIQIREDNEAEWPTSVVYDKEDEGANLGVYNKLHDSFIGLKFGDFVRIDDPNDNYPLDAAHMAANYEEVKED